MLHDLLGKVEAAKFCISQIVMDHDIFMMDRDIFMIDRDIFMMDRDIFMNHSPKKPKLGNLISMTLALTPTVAVCGK